MDATSQTTTNPLTGSPTIANQNTIQWAESARSKPAEPINLDEQYEAAKARNWISERLITQSQRHWHCTREAAIERLLAQHK